MVQRRDELRQLESELPIGPAGSPIKELHTTLKAAYQRLKRNLDDLDGLVRRNFKHGEWQEIAEIIDDVAEESDAFGRSTVLVSPAQTNKRAKQLQSKRDAAMKRVRNIEIWLSPAINRVHDEAFSIYRKKTPGDAILISVELKKLEELAVIVIQGWRKLMKEKEQMEAVSDAVELTLTDSVFERIMAQSERTIPDKDCE